MKSEWKTIRADEFCSLVTDGTHDSPKPQAAGRKLITSKHLKGYYLDFESANWISSEDYEKVIARSSVEQWDILYSMIGTIGNVYLEKNPVVDYACKNVGIFKFGGNCNKAYWMYYYLKSPQAMEFIKAHLRGTTQLYVPLATLREMPVPVPDEEEMNKIVAILRTLDDKIQCSIKINDNLLRQAQALFKSWFVDFEPFSNQKPSGWSVSTLGNVSIMGAGGDKPQNVSPIKSNLCQYPIYSNGLSEEGLYGFTDKPKIFKESVTVSARGTIGFVCLRHIPYVPTVRLVTLIPKTEIISAKYLYLWLKQLHITGTGTTQQQLTVPDFQKTEILVPSKEIVTLFTATVEPIFEKIWANQSENEKLSSLRDTLLPKLMSGEIDVSDIQL